MTQSSEEFVTPTHFTHWKYQHHMVQWQFLAMGQSSRNFRDFFQPDKREPKVCQIIGNSRLIGRSILKGNWPLWRLYLIKTRAELWSLAGKNASTGC